MTGNLDANVVRDQPGRALRLETAGRLAGAVAHDLKNILSGIAGFADLLRAQVDPGTKLSRHAERIALSTMRAAALVHRLFGIARMVEPVSVPLDVSQCVERAVCLLRCTLDPGVQVTASLLADDHVVNGEEDDITNALLYLGLIAAEAATRGGTLVFSTGNSDTVAPGPPTAGREVPGLRCAIISVTSRMSAASKPRQGSGATQCPRAVPLGNSWMPGFASVHRCLNRMHGFLDTSGAPAAFSIVIPLAAAEKVSIR